jgi:hypothetical protein
MPLMVILLLKVFEQVSIRIWIWTMTPMYPWLLHQIDNLSLCIDLRHQRHLDMQTGLRTIQ